MKSLQNGFVIVVYEHLVLKFEGKMTALCLKDFKAPDGSKFKKGYFYSPNGTEIRSFFREEYIGGTTKIKKKVKGDWAEARQTSDSSRVKVDDMMLAAEEYAKSVSGKKLSPEDAAKRYANTSPEGW